MTGFAARATAIAGLAAAMLIAEVPAADAARPGYENVPGSAGETGFPGSPGVERAHGMLPFTGSNLLLLAALGCLLLAGGLILARASRARS